MRQGFICQDFYSSVPGTLDSGVGGLQGNKCHGDEFRQDPEIDLSNLEPLMSGKLLLLATVTLTALCSQSNAPAFAQGHMGTPQEQQACSRDASRLCRKELGNDGAVQGCLQANRAKLSRSCGKVFESHGM
ncbi:hypothetical protein M2427_000276 [Bradyrhizobium sp. BR13661]|jgi:hypothetical protein|nr:hypothetical protein [Bradyrhizobium sp. BR13661]